MCINHQNLKELFEKYAEIMENNKDWLTELDSRAGDSDIGLTMSIGFREASSALNESHEEDLGMLLFVAGRTMSMIVPSTMGTLIGMGFMSAGKKLKGKKYFEIADLAEWFEVMYVDIKRVGKAELGEKTILDALGPLYEALRIASIHGDDFVLASKKAAIAACKGYEDTKGMIALHGKAASHGEKTKKFEDPGAAVAMLLAQAMEQYFDQNGYE